MKITQSIEYFLSGAFLEIQKTPEMRKVVNRKINDYIIIRTNVKID